MTKPAEIWVNFDSNGAPLYAYASEKEGVDGAGPSFPVTRYILPVIPAGAVEDALKFFNRLVKDQKRIGLGVVYAIEARDYTVASAATRAGRLALWAEFEAELDGFHAQSIEAKYAILCDVIKKFRAKFSTTVGKFEQCDGRVR